jgi:nitrogen-specific signal transduction histidine kinase/ActR/RegA family two-component response regulator
VPHLFTVVRDITEQRREERERLALVERLRHAQKLEAIGRLTSGVAHDFNNVITSILASAQLLRDELAPDHPGHADVDQVAADARRAGELTRQLLLVARKHVAAPQVFRIEDRSRSLEKLLHRVAGASLTVETRFAEGSWPVFVDPGQVEQVILNLAVNARDAMQAGGTLAISTENVTVPGDPAPRGAVPPGEYVLLTVSDTGIGMAPEVLAHAFEPFFTTKDEHGTGLGLATCAEIICQAGGHIAVESAPGAGTRFRIHLPRAATVAGSPEAPQAIGITGEETILVVEDDHVVRRAAVRALEQLGYTVVDAASVSEATVKVSRHSGPLDCVVVDCVLPDGAGTDLAVRIRERHPGVQVLVVSGLPTFAAVGASSVHAFELMTKPYAPIDLARRVRLLLDEVTPRAMDGAIQR